MSEYSVMFDYHKSFATNLYYAFFMQKRRKNFYRHYSKNILNNNYDRKFMFTPPKN